MIDDINSRGFEEDGFRVSCPKCGHKFPLNEAVAGKIKVELESERAKVRTEEENRIRKEAGTAFEEKIIEKEQQIKMLSERVDQAREKELQLIKLKQDLELQQKDLPLKIQEGIENGRKEWEKNIEESARKNYEGLITKLNQTIVELNMTIGQQKNEVEEMKRKLEQGSQERQGEVQEQMLEETLRSTFPHDEIKTVPRGSPGADIIQVVRNNFGAQLGIIVWESKNTKAWSDKWIDKLRGDKEEAKGDYGVIISNVLPKEVNDFGVKKDMLIADYRLVHPIAYMLRNAILQRDDLLKANQDRSGKEATLYNFVLSPQFRDLVVNSASPIMELMHNLDKERASMQKIWAQRERELKTTLMNIARLYGNISGIVKLPDIPVFSIEPSQQKQLE